MRPRRSGWERGDLPADANPPRDRRAGRGDSVDDARPLLPRCRNGENLNEHILGDRWPAPDERLEMLEESIEVMRELWKGEKTTFRGKHYTVEGAASTAFRTDRRRSPLPPPHRTQPSWPAGATARRRCARFRPDREVRRVGRRGNPPSTGSSRSAGRRTRTKRSGRHTSGGRTSGSR